MCNADMLVGEYSNSAVYIPARAAITAIHKSPAPPPMRLSRNIRNGSHAHYLIALTRRSRIEVPHVDYEKLSNDRIGESSASIRQRVQAARDHQRKRFSSNGSSDIVCDADMRVGEIRQFCKLHDEGGALSLPKRQRLIRAATPCCA